jgi:tetratricopeptide (TPR) repeat protein
MTSELWGWLYWGQLCLLSLAVGSWLLHSPRLLPIPRQPRFLTGFCLTPFLLGSWMLGGAALAPGAPRWFFVGAPVLLSVLLLAKYGWRTLRRLVREQWRLHRRAGNPWPRYVLAGALIAVLSTAAPTVIAQGEAPVVAHDAAGYLNKALPFAQERNLDAVADLRHLDKGTYLRDHHGFLFPAYLSHALLNTGADKLGYPHDQAARIAFQATFLYLLCAMLALAGLTRSLGVGALSIVLLFQVPHLFFIPMGSSRDAYRIIPILLLVANLSGLHAARLRLRLRPAMLLPPLVLAAFCLAGHTLGGILAAVITACWLAWGLIQKAPRVHLLAVAAAIVAGLLWNGFRYVEAYLQSGTLLGAGLRQYSFQGTALEGIFRVGRVNEQARMAQQATPLQVLRQVLALDHYRLSLPALGAALGALLAGRYLQRHRAGRIMPFWGAVFAAFVLPLTGIFDYEGYKVSQAFASNDRYSLHLYPMAAILLSTCAFLLYEQLSAQGSLALRWLALATLLVGAWFAADTARATVLQDWPAVYPAQEADLLATLAPLRLASENLAPGERLLLDDDRFAYYLDSQALVMTGRPSWQAIRAQSKEEAQGALRRLHVGAVALLQADISGWWDQLLFYAFLQQPGATLLLQDELQRIYILAPEETMRRRLVYTLLAQAGKGAAPARLYEAIRRPPAVEGRDANAVLVPVAGDSRLEVGAPAEIIADCLALLQKEPGNAQAHFVLGQLYRARGDVDRAITHYEAASSNDPQDGRLPAYLAEAYIARGQALASQAVYSAAAQAFGQAYRLMPAEIAVRESIMAAYARWGEPVVSTDLLGEVLRGYQQAVAQEPDNAARYDELAQAQYMAHNLEAAAEIYETMLQRNLANGATYSKLTVIYMQQKQMDRAIAVYQRAIQQHTGKAWPSVELGKLHLLQAQTTTP